jgi:hypothetical protein
VGERRNGEDRRRQHGKRRDDPRAGRVEALHPVAEPADHEGEAKDEDAVREDRPDQRGLHERDQTVVEREEADEQLRQVPECRLDGACARRSEAATELLGCETDRAGEAGDRESGQREAENRMPAEKVSECRGGDEDRVDCQLDPLAPADRATLSQALGRCAQVVEEGA